METKDTPAVVMQEKVKANFDNYLFRTYSAKWATEFNRMPFYFRSGVITDYLRGKGIEAYALPVADKKYWAITEFYNAEGDFVQFDKVCDDHDTALISAINEGLRIVEEQLKDK